MKKIVLSSLIIIGLLANANAEFVANNSQKQALRLTKTKIANIYKNKGIDAIVDYKNEVNKLIEENRSDEEKMFFLRAIKNSLVSYIENGEDKTIETINTEEIKEDTEEVQTTDSDLDQRLIAKYGKEISGEISASCIKNYDFIDNIAKEQNFPTPLIIAMWKKEHNCHLDNPRNGWGAFQITSRYYNPGDISLDEFKQEIIDFINFSKNKIAYYNKDSGRFKAIFGNDDINLTYDTYSARDIRLYALLYNGIRKSANLETFGFANANLNSDLKSNSDGILTSFLKVLKWENK